jgi:hypothetical protein
MANACNKTYARLLKLEEGGISFYISALYKVYKRIPTTWATRYSSPAIRRSSSAAESERADFAGGAARP